MRMGHPRATREPVNVTIQPLLAAEAREFNIPFSATLEEALRHKVAEARRARWLADNDNAIDAYNERVAVGVFSADLRRF